MINGYSWICLLEAFGMGVLCLAACILAIVLMALALAGVIRGLKVLTESIPPSPSIQQIGRMCRKLRLGAVAKWVMASICILILAALLTQIGMGLLRSIGTSCKVG